MINLSGDVEPDSGVTIHYRLGKHVKHEKWWWTKGGYPFYIDGNGDARKYRSSGNPRGRLVREGRPLKEGDAPSHNKDDGKGISKDDVIPDIVYLISDLPQSESVSAGL